MRVINALVDHLARADHLASPFLCNIDVTTDSTHVVLNNKVLSTGQSLVIDDD